MDSYRATLSRMPELENRIATRPGRFRVLTGERPTGRLHLGHYFGTIRERVRLQELGVDTFVILADYQVITDREVGGDIAGNVRNLLLDNIAAGLDPERATIFTHSSVPALNQLMLPFLSLVSVAELQRTPFDAPIADAEIVFGPLTEYTGLRFAFFLLAEYAGMVVMALLFAVLFLGGWRGPWGDVGAVGAVWTLLKATLVGVLFLWLRVAWPRVREDQLQRFAWLVLLPLARRNRAVLATILSGLVFESSLLFLAASPDYRYSHWMIVCTLIAVVELTARRMRTPEA